jgi:glycosyltransferase involved in cell wall biosynthesis
MSRLSVVVTTLNEAGRIEGTLERLAFADEVLVVDSFSADGTPEIARSLGARVLQHEYESPAAQKNWAIPRTEHDWVLIVDADEWVPKDLAREVRRAIAAPDAFDGYQIRRRNFFLGKEIRHSGWQNDWVLRLFRRGHGRYLERQVHERMEVDGAVGRLKGQLVHHSYRSLDDYWMKLRRYAEWNAMEACRRGARVSPAYMIAHPVLRFLKSYVLQRGFLDGAHGLVLCLLTAVYAAAKDARIWELQHEVSPGGDGAAAASDGAEQRRSPH